MAGLQTSILVIGVRFPVGAPFQDGVLDSLVVRLPWAQVVGGSNPTPATISIFFRTDGESNPVCLMFQRQPYFHLLPVNRAGLVSMEE